jgi:polar amino acid transport system permease protein
MRWDFTSVLVNTDALLAGAVGTVRIFAICLVLGLSFGLVVGLGRYAHTKWLYLPATAFVEFFRNTPVLVQILWFYFAMPLLVPFSISPLAAAALGISLNSAAFSAEVYRAGIQSIERGQWDGARAIGMTHTQALQRIILPQAVKRMIPAFMERAIELMKTTTLVATIAYADLLFAANEVSQKSFRPLETYTVVALIYFVVIFLASQLARLLELRLARSGESTVH